MSLLTMFSFHNNQNSASAAAPKSRKVKRIHGAIDPAGELRVEKVLVNPVDEKARAFVQGLIKERELEVAKEAHERS